MPHDRVGQEAFAVIREAMRSENMAALGRVVLAKRERVIMLQPWGKGLMGTTLRYPYEIRDAKEYFEDIPNVSLEPDMLKLAEHILRSKTTDFNPSRFVDRYEEAVVEMLKKKQAGLAVSRERQAPRPENVVNLMDALRSSIAQEKGRIRPAEERPQAHQGTRRDAASDSRQEGQGCRGKADRTIRCSSKKGKLIRLLRRTPPARLPFDPLAGPPA
jgi:DNA end-binding protein Ku